MEHELKTWPAYFQEVYIGRKTFEARLNDRNFQMLDILRLREFDPNAQGGLGAYTGRECIRMVGYILYGVADPVLGGMEAAHASIAPGYVILSLVPPPRDTEAALAKWREQHGYESRMSEAGALPGREATVEAFSFRLQLTRSCAAIVARLWAAPSGPVPTPVLNAASAPWSPRFDHAKPMRNAETVRVLIWSVRERLGRDFILHRPGDGYMLSPGARSLCREALTLGPPR